ncbi:hypothetical protein ADUPG1_010401, partial [Aduncisulcus paluster]
MSTDSGTSGDPTYGSENRLNLNHLKRLQALFDEADADKGGSLDIDEFCEAFKDVLGKEMSKIEIERLFMSIDADCNGEVDWDEFVNYLMFSREAKESKDTNFTRLAPTVSQDDLFYPIEPHNRHKSNVSHTLIFPSSSVSKALQSSCWRTGIAKGPVIISTSPDCQLLVWDLEKFRPIATIDLKMGGPRSLSRVPLWKSNGQQGLPGSSAPSLTSPTSTSDAHLSGLVTSMCIVCEVLKIGTKEEEEDDELKPLSLNLLSAKELRKKNRRRHELKHAQFTFSAGSSVPSTRPSTSFVQSISDRARDSLLFDSDVGVKIGTFISPKVHSNPLIEVRSSIEATEGGKGGVADIYTTSVANNIGDSISNSDIDSLSMSAYVLQEARKEEEERRKREEEKRREKKRREMRIIAEPVTTSKVHWADLKIIKDEERAESAGSVRFNIIRSSMASLVKIRRGAKRTEGEDGEEEHTAGSPPKATPLAFASLRRQIIPNARARASLRRHQFVKKDTFLWSGSVPILPPDAAALPSTFLVVTDVSRSIHMYDLSTFKCVASVSGFPTTILCTYFVPLHVSLRPVPYLIMGDMNGCVYVIAQPRRLFVASTAEINSLTPQPMHRQAGSKAKSTFNSQAFFIPGVDDRKEKKRKECSEQHQMQEKEKERIRTPEIRGDPRVSSVKTRRPYRIGKNDKKKYLPSPSQRLHQLEATLEKDKSTNSTGTSFTTPKPSTPSAPRLPGIHTSTSGSHTSTSGSHTSTSGSHTSTSGSTSSSSDSPFLSSESHILHFPHAAASSLAPYFTALKLHDGWVTDIIVPTHSPSLAVTSSLDGTVKVWEWRSGIVRRVLRGHKSGVVCMAYSAKHRVIVSGGSDRRVCIFNLHLSTPVAEIPITGNVHKIIVCDELNVFFVLCGEKEFYCYDIKSHSLLSSCFDKVLRRPENDVKSFDIDFDNKRIIFSSSRPHEIKIFHTQTQALMLEMESGKEIADERKEENGDLDLIQKEMETHLDSGPPTRVKSEEEKGPITKVRERSGLASVEEKSSKDLISVLEPVSLSSVVGITVKINKPTPKNVHLFPSHRKTDRGNIIAVLFNDQFDQIVSVDVSGGVCVSAIPLPPNTNSSPLLFSFRNAHGVIPLSYACFDSSKRRLLTGGSDGKIMMWNYNSGAPLASFSDHTTEIVNVIHSNYYESKYVVFACGLDPKICIWEEAVEPESKRVVDVGNDVLCACMCPELLVCVGTAEEMRLVIVNSGLKRAYLSFAPHHHEFCEMITNRRRRLASLSFVKKTRVGSRLAGLTPSESRVLPSDPTKLPQSSSSLLGSVNTLASSTHIGDTTAPSPLINPSPSTLSKQTGQGNKGLTHHISKKLLVQRQQLINREKSVSELPIAGLEKKSLDQSTNRLSSRVSGRTSRLRDDMPVSVIHVTPLSSPSVF